MFVVRPVEEKDSQANSGFLSLTATYHEDHPTGISAEEILWQAPLRKLNNYQVISLKFTDKSQPTRCWKPSVFFRSFVEPFPNLQHLYLEHVKLGLEYVLDNGAMRPQAPPSRRPLKSLTFEEMEQNDDVNPFHFFRYFHTIEQLTIRPSSSRSSEKLEASDYQLLDWVKTNLHPYFPKVESVIMHRTAYARAYYTMLIHPSIAPGITSLQLAVSALSDISVLKVLLSCVPNLEQLLLDFDLKESAGYDRNGNSILWAFLIAGSELQAVSMMEALTTRNKLKRLSMRVGTHGGCPGVEKPLWVSAWALPGLIASVSPSVEELQIEWKRECPMDCKHLLGEHLGKFCGQWADSRQEFCRRLAMALESPELNLKKVKLGILDTCWTDNGGQLTVLKDAWKADILKKTLLSGVEGDVHGILEEYIDRGQICWIERPVAKNRGK